MAAFIILAVVILPCAVACWWWLTDWQAIEEENKRYYTAEGHHIYYDRKLIAALQKEYLQPIITQYFIDNKSEIWLLFLIAHSKR